jgi:glycosyltransferase involved in cell wall biosynthesis
VDVVYEAPAPEFAPLDIAPGETRRFTRAYGAGKNHTISLQAHSFGLFVSTLEPRKNLPTLLRALHVCLNRRTYTPYRLVVAGARGWHEQAIFDAVRDLGLGDAVLFVGSVAPGDLRWLYNACVFYANPSLYEGFGLPVVEAMACGAPSLVANASSLPEVAGDAAILLPPEDVEAWADAMQRIWHDEALQAELSQRGQVQAGQFSWDRAARETLAVYRRAGRGAS